MTSPIISVENLSKVYHIGLKDEIPDTLAAAFAGWVKTPLRKFQHLRRLNTFGRHSSNGHSTNGHAPATSPAPSPASENGESNLFWALKDVSFDVAEGEVVGIIGRNGAGKSTLLKILSRITEPTSGRAVIRGRVSSLLEVGTGFHPELTGRDNVYLNGTILGMTKREIDRKFDEIVAFSGVEKFLDTPIKHYSSGMKVRLAFAVAAHLEPEILIVDEVLAVGDAEFQKKCMGKMQDVAATGRTVLFVSHNMAAMERLCNVAILLEKGEISVSGDTKSVVQAYASTFEDRSILDESGILSPDRINEYGDGRHVIQSIRIHDEHENRTRSIRVGRPFRIDIGLDGFSGLPQAQVGVIFRNPHGQRLVNFNTGMSPPEYNGRADKEIASLSVKLLPLTPGLYYIDVSVASKIAGRLDYVESAIEIEILEHDIYGSGYGVHSRDALTFMLGEWEVLAADHLGSEILTT